MKKHNGRRHEPRKIIRKPDLVGFAMCATEQRSLVDELHQLVPFGDKIIGLSDIVPCGCRCTVACQGFLQGRLELCRPTHLKSFEPTRENGVGASQPNRAAGCRNAVLPPRVRSDLSLLGSPRGPVRMVLIVQPEWRACRSRMRSVPACSIALLRPINCPLRLDAVMKVSTNRDRKEKQYGADLQQDGLLPIGPPCPRCKSHRGHAAARKNLRMKR